MLAQMSHYLQHSAGEALAAASLTDAVSELVYQGVALWASSAGLHIAEAFLQLDAPRALQEAALVGCPDDLLPTMPDALLEPALTARCVIETGATVPHIMVPVCLVDTPQARKHAVTALAEVRHVRVVKFSNFDLRAGESMAHVRQLAECLTAPPAVEALDLCNISIDCGSLACLVTALPAHVIAVKASSIRLNDPGPVPPEAIRSRRSWQTRSVTHSMGRRAQTVLQEQPRPVG
jgi:hypothetical protein